MQPLLNKGWRLEATCITFLSLSIITLVLRAYTRIRIINAFGVDDWLMVFTTITFTIFTACALVAEDYGVGRHLDTLTQEEIEGALKFWWLGCLFYGITVAGSRLTIGTFLLRLSVRRAHTVIIYLIMGMSVVVAIIFFFIVLLQCHPISYFWDRTQEGSCISLDAISDLTYPYSAFSMCSDFTFALLPIFMLRNLQMNTRTKIALIPILGLGCIASVAIATRFAFMEDVEEEDFLWHIITIAILSTGEQGLAITAGNLATLRPLVRTILQRFGWMQPASEPQESFGPLPPTIGSQEMVRENPRLNDLENGDINIKMAQRESVWMLFLGSLLNFSQDRIRVKDSMSGVNNGSPLRKEFTCDSDGSRSDSGKSGLSYDSRRRLSDNNINSQSSTKADETDRRKTMG